MDRRPMTDTPEPGCMVHLYLTAKGSEITGSTAVYIADTIADGVGWWNGPDEDFIVWAGVSGFEGWSYADGDPDTPRHRRLYKPERNDYAEKLQAQVDEILAHEPGFDDPPKRPLTDFLGLNIDEVRYGALLIMMSDDDPPARYDLIPPEALHSLAVTYGIGAKKHGERNWQEVGIKATDNLASMRRHMDLLDRGVDIDPDDGQDTAAAIMFRAAAHIYYAKHRPDLDDRPSVTEPAHEWRSTNDVPKWGARIKIRGTKRHNGIYKSVRIGDVPHIDKGVASIPFPFADLHRQTEWRYV